MERVASCKVMTSREVITVSSGKAGYSTQRGVELLSRGCQTTVKEDSIEFRGLMSSSSLVFQNINPTATGDKGFFLGRHRSFQVIS